jgi:uncharacterized protein (DUF433 family)
MTLPDFLTRDADGEIRLTGHRIGLYTVVRCLQEGATPEGVAEEYPTLPLELVRRVLAFYREHRPEVDTYVTQYRAELERQEAADTPAPGALKLRQLAEDLRAADARHADDPGWRTLPVSEKLRRIKDEHSSRSP